MAPNTPPHAGGISGPQRSPSSASAGPLLSLLSPRLQNADDEGPASPRQMQNFKGLAHASLPDSGPVGLRVVARQGAVQSNRLLASLSSEAVERMRPKSEMVLLTPGMRLMEAERACAHVYFPCSANVSLVLTTRKGQTCQVGMVGSEGLVGVQSVVSGLHMPYDAVVRSAGVARRISVEAVSAECSPGSPGGALLARYAQALMCQMAYNVSCCQHHTIEQRTCRLLLQLFDSCGSELRMTQEMMAECLGVRRESITVVAYRLAHDNVISYRRGCVSLLNRTALEARSCECYAMVKRALELTFAMPRSDAMQTFSGAKAMTPSPCSPPYQ